MATSAPLHGNHSGTSPPEPEPLAEHLVERGRAVRAGRGFEWLASGVTLFTRRPLAWIGAAVVYWAIEAALSFVPFLGPFVATIVAPIFMGGMMLGCQELDEGRPLRVRHLFAGFERRFVPLLVVSLLWQGAMIAAGLLLGGALLAVLGALPTRESIPEPARVAALLPIFAVVLLTVNMAFIHTPGLVAVSGRSPVEAIKSSFRGCLRNIAPFMVYCATLVLLMVGTLGIFFWIGRALGTEAVVLLGVPYMIAFGSSLIGSMFAAFRDIFCE